MKFGRSLKAALAASVCLLPLQAAAQSLGSAPSQDKPAATAAPAAPGDNWISIGAQYQSGRSYYFGRYNGAVIRASTGWAISTWACVTPGTPAVPDTSSWTARHLGFPDRSVTLKVGQQGTWGVTFSYDGIPYYTTESFLSVWQSNGALVAGVAPRIGEQHANVAGILWNSPLSTQRDILTAIGKYQWGDWTFTGSVTARPQGGPAGQLDGHPRRAGRDGHDTGDLRPGLLRPADRLRHGPLRRAGGIRQRAPAGAGRLHLLAIHRQRAGVQRAPTRSPSPPERRSARPDRARRGSPRSTRRRRRTPSTRSSCCWATTSAPPCG